MIVITASTLMSCNPNAGAFGQPTLNDVRRMTLPPQDIPPTVISYDNGNKTSTVMFANGTTANMQWVIEPAYDDITGALLPNGQGKAGTIAMVVPVGRPSYIQTNPDGSTTAGPGTYNTEVGMTAGSGRGYVMLSKLTYVNGVLRPTIPTLVSVSGYWVNPPGISTLDIWFPGYHRLGEIGFNTNIRGEKWIR